jgi:hypothetical protein
MSHKREINLVSPEYQAAYLLATRRAGLTGDSVYEVRTQTLITFATGKDLARLTQNRQSFFGAKTIESIIRIK